MVTAVKQRQQIRVMCGTVTHLFHDSPFFTDPNGPQRSCGLDHLSLALMAADSFGCVVVSPETSINAGSCGLDPPQTCLRRIANLIEGLRDADDLARNDKIRFFQR